MHFQDLAIVGIGWLVSDVVARLTLGKIAKGAVSVSWSLSVLSHPPHMCSSIHVRNPVSLPFLSLTSIGLMLN